MGSLVRVRDAVGSVGERVNLIGLVTELATGAKSKGTDYHVTIRIVDDSSLTVPLAVAVFTRTMEELPQVASVGDIVMFRHVVMKVNDLKVFAVFNKKFSTFGLFHGGIDASFVPYQQSTNFTSRHQDAELIGGLRKLFTNPPVGTETHEFKCLDEKCLDEIEEGICNLLCKILHISEVHNDQCMLYVWDGTDAPPVHAMSKLSDEMDNPLPLCLETLSLSREVLSSIPLGTVLCIPFSQCKVKLVTNFPESGKWARFLNVNCVTRFGLWHAELTPFTRLCYLPEDNEIVLKRVRLHEERLLGKWSRMPSTCFPWHSNLTETEFPDWSFYSLMHILTHPQAEKKFRCVVRVVAMHPWEVENFRSSDGIYRMRFTLEDPTARIHAMLYDDEEVRFFEDDETEISLTRKRNKLLGISETAAGEVEDAGRNPPWVEIILSTYHTDRNDRLLNKDFFIYGTKFVG